MTWTKSQFNGLKATLSQHGFNITHGKNVRDLNANHPTLKQLLHLFPKTQSILLIANGGPMLWQHYSTWLERQIKTYVHPLDTYTYETLHRVFYENHFHPDQCKLCFPFYEEQLPEGGWINFQALGLETNLSVFSPLGLNLHRKFGPWTSFRGLALLDDVGDYPNDEEVGLFNPCPTCSAPCISICPPQAISRNGLDHKACYTFRLQPEKSACFDKCQAREACPIAQEEQFPREEIAYHYTFGLKLSL